MEWVKNHTAIENGEHEQNERTKKKNVKTIKRKSFSFFSRSIYNLVCYVENRIMEKFTCKNGMGDWKEQAKQRWNKMRIIHFFSNVNVFLSLFSVLLPAYTQWKLLLRSLCCAFCTGTEMQNAFELDGTRRLYVEDGLSFKICSANRMTARPFQTNELLIPFNSHSAFRFSYKTQRLGRLE